MRFELAPLLFRRVEERSASVPPEALERLRDAFTREVGLAFFRLRQLGELVDGLASAGIPCLVLKGPAVAQEAYGDPALRSMSDLDVLVPRPQVEEAEAALFALGYSGSRDAWEDVFPKHYHLSYRKPGALVQLELHWHLHRPTLPFHIPIDEIWSRSRTAELAGRRVQVMEATDQFLYLCVHIAKHRMRVGPRPFCDLVHLLEAAPPDWDALLERGRQWRAGRHLALVLAVYSRLYPRSLPDGVLDALSGDLPPEPLIETALHLVLEPSLKASEEELKVAGHRPLFGLNARPSVLRRRYPRLPLPLAYLWHYVTRIVNLAWGKLRQQLDGRYRRHLEESVSLETWLTESG